MDKSFQDKISNLVNIKELHFDGNRITIDSSWPMWLTLDVNPLGPEARLRAVFNCRGIAGDKSDYLQVISAIFSSTLRAFDFANPHVIFSIDEFTGIGINHAESFIDLDPKNERYEFNTEKINFSHFEDLLDSFKVSANIISKLMIASGETGDGGECIEGKASSLTKSILKIIGNSSDEIIFSTRRRPNWSYGGDFDHMNFFVHFESPIEKLPSSFVNFNHNMALKNTSEGLSIKSKSRINLIPKSTSELIDKLKAQISKDLLLIPINNYVYSFIPEGIIGLSYES